MAKKVVLAGACRTAIGTMGGGLSTTPAPVLGSIVIKEALSYFFNNLLPKKRKTGLLTFSLLLYLQETSSEVLFSHVFNPR